MKYSILLLISLFVLSCDDPSLDGPEQQDEVVEPVADLRELSSIQVAVNNATNITRDINFNYNNKELLSEIVETGSTNQSIQASYNNGNQLQLLSISDNMQPAMNAVVTHGNSDTNAALAFIRLTYSVSTTGFVTEKTLFIDIQNRFNRVLTTQIDALGNSIIIEDLRLQYSQNFNVLRINSFDSTGLFITAYSEFTYNFNNNPFADMNDVIRLFVFEEFVPYSRFLPATRLDYDLSTGSAILERSINYMYVLDIDGYPISRELMINEGGMLTSNFEFFNYRP